MNTLDELRAGKLQGARALKLSCELETFPAEIFNLSETLETLDLSGNNLTSLPADLPKLRRLHTLFCSQNDFTELPPILGACAQLDIVGFKSNKISTVTAGSIPTDLRWLILTDNRIDQLPDRLGDCHRLQKLMLAGNQIDRIPETLSKCHQLELIRLSANRLRHFPEPLLELPNLSWIAFSGNLFNATHERETALHHRLPSLAWNDLQLQGILGQGASGVIYRAATRKGAQWPETVAVKVFKGNITSDGFPHDEAAIASEAGTHPALVTPIANVTGHPSGSAALALPLVDPEFKVMAGPPSLSSCTRDAYPDEAAFSLAQLLGIARDIAAAAAHLHCRGLMHGDIYAHNVLVSGAKAYLGDFGAASRFPAHDSTSKKLQKIEAQAFGHLLDEMISRCTELNRSLPVSTALSDLRSALRSNDIATRPLLSDVSSRLELLG